MHIDSKWLTTSLLSRRLAGLKAANDDKASNFKAYMGYHVLEFSSQLACT